MPDALHLLKNGSEVRASFSMLVAGLGLPAGLNGRQLADAGRELIPGKPVLLVAGYAGTALGKDQDLAPGMELLTKPFALDALPTACAGLAAERL